MYITPKEAYKMMQDSKDYYFIDVREFDEYKESHPEGAVNMPLSSFKENIENIPADKIPVVVCMLGVRSKKAVSILTKNGFAKAYNIKGGFSEWTKDKLPVDKRIDA